MGGKGGGRIGRRELQAHGEGGEAGEGCRVVKQAVERGPCVIWASMLLCARSKVSDLFLLLRSFALKFRLSYTKYMSTSWRTRVGTFASLLTAELKGGRHWKLGRPRKGYIHIAAVHLAHCRIQWPERLCHRSIRIFCSDQNAKQSE